MFVRFISFSYFFHFHWRPKYFCWLLFFLLCVASPLSLLPSPLLLPEHRKEKKNSRKKQPTIHIHHHHRHTFKSSRLLYLFPVYIPYAIIIKYTWALQCFLLMRCWRREERKNIKNRREERRRNTPSCHYTNRPCHSTIPPPRQKRQTFTCFLYYFFSHNTTHAFFPLYFIFYFFSLNKRESLKKK